MSSISSVNGSGIDLAQLMGLMGKGSHHHHKAASAAASQQTSATDGSTDLKSQLQAAVVGAIQNFDASSGSASDLMTAIQTAITGTLKANGITMDKSGQYQASASGQSGLATATGSQLDTLLQQNGITTEQFKDGLLAMFQGSQTGSTTGSAAANQDASQGFDLSSILAQLFKNVPTGTGVNVQA